MGRSFVNQQPPTGGILAADEVIAALEALSPDDKLKLAEIESQRLHGTDFTPGELIQEALYRALAGERNCPRHVSFVAFIAQTMRSIASHNRDQRRRATSLDEMLPADTAENSRAANPLGTTSDPEDNLMQKQDAAAVQAIHSWFNNDPEAQLVLLGWQDGLRGAELRDATGLAQGQLDYAIRRIRTRMRKAYPHGWTV